MNNIRELRESKQLTLAKLAEMTGISAQQLNRLEKSERRLNEDNMREIARALGCRPQDIIVDSGSEASKNDTLVTVVAMADTSQGGRLVPLGSAEQYELPMRPLAKFKRSRLIGVVVDGSGHKRYPKGAELIFAELSPHFSAPLSHGQTVLAEIKRGGKLECVIATLRMAGESVTLEFEGKDFRHCASTPYIQAHAQTGLNDPARTPYRPRSAAAAPPAIPRQAGDIRIAAVLVKSITPEL